MNRTQVERLVRMLAKMAASGLRDRLRIVQNQMGPEHITGQGYSAMLGDKRVGTMLLDHPDIAQALGNTPRVHWSNLDPSFQGMGVGPKMYGEVMRQLPDAAMSSDTTLSPGSKRLYERMGKTPGYTVAPNNPYNTTQHPDISDPSKMNTWHEAKTTGQSIYPDARLPAAAQKKPAGPSNELWDTGHTTPQYKDPSVGWEFGRKAKEPIGDPSGLKPAEMSSPQRQALIDQKRLPPAVQQMKTQELLAGGLPKTAPEVAQSIAAPGMQDAAALGARFPASSRIGPAAEALATRDIGATLGRAVGGVGKGILLGALPGAVGGAAAGWNVPPPGESRGHAAVRQGLQGAWETGVRDPAVSVKDIAQMALNGYKSIPGALGDAIQDPRGAANAVKDLSGQAYKAVGEAARPAGAEPVSQRANTPGLFNPMWGGSAVRGGRALQG